MPDISGGDIYEVRADARHVSFRVLFASEGRQGQVLLALEVISKKTPKMPLRTVDLAEARLRDWRMRSTRA